MDSREHHLPCEMTEWKLRCFVASTKYYLQVEIYHRKLNKQKNITPSWEGMICYVLRNSLNLQDILESVFSLCKDKLKNEFLSFQLPFRKRKKIEKHHETFAAFPLIPRFTPLKLSIYGGFLKYFVIMSWIQPGTNRIITNSKMRIRLVLAHFCFGSTSAVADKTASAHNCATSAE